MKNKTVMISGIEYIIFAEGSYVTKSGPDKPYKKYKLVDNKVLVVSGTEDFAYFGEDFGDLGIEPCGKVLHYKGKEFRLITADQQILKSVYFGKPEGNVEFWDYEAVEDESKIISIGKVLGTNKRSDVVGDVISKKLIELG